MAQTRRAKGSAAADAALFRQMFALLDSDQPGERQAALEKLFTLRKPKSWPGFGDLLERLENTVPLATLQAREAELAQWKQAHDALAHNNAALARINAALRSAVWLNTNWRGIRRLACMAATVGLASFAGYKVYRLLPQTDPATIATAKAADQADDRAFHGMLSRTKWGMGETPPAVVRIGDVPYWIIIAGDVDATSHADALGQPVKRECLRLYADKAESHAGAYLAPHPRNILGYVKWPLRAVECRTRTSDGQMVTSND